MPAWQRDQFIQQAKVNWIPSVPTYTAKPGQSWNICPFYSRYIMLRALTLRQQIRVFRKLFYNIRGWTKSLLWIRDTAFTVFWWYQAGNVIWCYRHTDNIIPTVRRMFFYFHVVSGQNYLLGTRLPGIIYLNEYGNPDTVVNDPGNRWSTRQTLMATNLP